MSLMMPSSHLKTRLRFGPHVTASSEPSATSLAFERSFASQIASSPVVSSFSASSSRICRYCSLRTASTEVSKLGLELRVSGCRGGGMALGQAHQPMMPDDSKTWSDSDRSASDGHVLGPCS